MEAYQLFKARASGADAVLLVAAVLPNSDLAYLIKAAAKCNLQVLLEVHSIAGEVLLTSQMLGMTGQHASCASLLEQTVGDEAESEPGASVACINDGRET